MRRFATIAGVITLIMTAAGCSKGQLMTFPVTGELFVDGKPAEDAFVYLYPAGGDLAKDAPNPFGQVGKDGRFTLSSYGKDDGAPAGDYVVCFSWHARSGLAKQRFDGPDKLKEKYNDKEKSTFKVTIKKEPNTLARFELKSPK
jgi:hypothetical protein